MDEGVENRKLTYFLYAWTIMVLGLYLFQFRDLVGPILHLLGLA